MNQIQGTIFDIKKYSIHDGPGIRTTIFFKGCPLRCWWCQNPESQNMKPDIVPAGISKRKFHIQYRKDKELIGMEMTAEEVMSELRKDIIFYDESEGGVTFSGGEPLFQPDFLHQLLIECKNEDMHTAVDTCGYASRKDLERIMPLTDVFLFDLKLMDDQEHKRYTGVRFQPIKDNLIFLSKQNCAINIRIPIVPDITDTTINLEQMIHFISQCENIIKVSILPLNHLGDKKYNDLGRQNTLKNTPPPSDERMEEIQQQFQDSGFITEIGG